MQNFNTTNFRLYAKFNGQKQFKPLDINEGIQVNNLIHATIVPAENLEKLKQLVKLNSNVCHMQVRDLNNNIVF